MEFRIIETDKGAIDIPEVREAIKRIIEVGDHFQLLTTLLLREHIDERWKK